MNKPNKFFHVGEVVYGESFKTELDFIDGDIESFKFNCPCVTASYNPDTNIIIATFVGNEKPKGSKPYHKIIELFITFKNGISTTFDLQLLIINDYDITRES